MRLLTLPLAQITAVLAAEPPAFSLGLQLIAWALFGLPGVVVIIPFAAAGAVFVHELYVRDRLGVGWGTEDEARRRCGLIGLLVRSRPQQR
jgi:hypothetical protein